MTTAKLPIKIFVINLPDCLDRRINIEKQLNRLDLDFEFIDAIDGRGKPVSSFPEYDSLKRRLFFGRDLQPAEIGCLLSHRRCYEMMVSQNIQTALILEDDAILEDDVPHVLHQIINSQLEWDLIRFIDEEKVLLRKCRHIGMLYNKYEIARLPTNAGGARGYLLNQRGASRLLNLMQHNWLQNDVLHSRAWMTGLVTYIVRPSPILHPIFEIGNSIIGKTRFQKNKELTRTLGVLHPFARFAMRLQDQVMKLLFYAISIRKDKKNRHSLDLHQESVDENHID